MRRKWLELQVWGLHKCRQLWMLFHPGADPLGGQFHWHKCEVELAELESQRFNRLFTYQGD